MYKSLTLNKIEQVRTGEKQQPNCKDCQAVGHYNKKYYKCKFYKEEKSDDVGTSGKRQNFQVKQDKRDAKKQRVDIDQNVTCASCKRKGHKTSRSPKCQNHRASKLEVMVENLGGGFQVFTRKIPLDSCVQQQYKSVLKNRILSASEDVRQLLFRAQLFVNYYILLHCNEDIPKCIYQQNFWYSMCQLINNRRITNSKDIPPGLLDDWSNFRRQHPTIVYSVNLASGNSHCVTEACVQVATTYLNAIVETFEKRVMSYLYYLIQNICMSMKPDQVKLIVKEYFYQYVCRGEPKWPTSIDLSNEGKLKIRDSCNTLRNLSNESISLKSLSASPGNYVRWFSYILSIYEEDHRAHSPFDVRRLPLPRRFSITPIPSCRCKFVTVSASALSSFIKGTRPTGYEGQLELFNRVFDFTKLRFRDISELRPDGEKTVLFDNIVKSDGFAVDFVFCRKNQKSMIGTHDLTLEDFTYDEVESVYRPAFIDPGRKSVFTAAVGLGDDHQVGRCSTKEYYDLTGSTKYTIKLQNLKNEAGITPIETDIPTAKTCLAAVYHTYAAYMLLHRQALFDFYGFQRAKDRFYLYQGRQKAPQIMVNMLVNGGKKYNRRRRSKKKKRAKKKRRMRQQNRAIPPTAAKIKWRPAKFEQDIRKVPLIVFGDGMFGKDSVKLKGNRAGVTGVLWRAIKKREKEGDLLAITIDEFKTSRICYRCYEDSLKKVDNVKGVSVLGCENCKTLWQHDVNAAKYMLLISSYIWNDHDRPFMFRRRATTA